FFFQAEDGIRGRNVTGVQTCALPILPAATERPRSTRPRIRGCGPSGSWSLRSGGHPAAPSRRATAVRRNADRVPAPPWRPRRAKIGRASGRGGGETVVGSGSL